MKYQFTIRQLLIFIVDAAILSAGAERIAQTDELWRRLGLSLLFLFFPLSLGLLLYLFDRPPVRNLYLAATGPAETIALFVWWLWFYNLFLDKAARNEMAVLNVAMHILLMSLMSVWTLGLPPIKKSVVRLLARPNRDSKIWFTGDAFRSD